MGKYVESILSDGEVLLHQGQVSLAAQVPLGRMFDFGTVWVSGAGTPQASIPNVQDPMAFRRAVFAAQETTEPRFQAQ